MLAAAAGIPRRFGFSVAECQPFLTDTLPIPGGHAVAANQDLAQLAARRLGGELPVGTTWLDPTFPVLPDEASWARRWLAEQFEDAGYEVDESGFRATRTENPIVAVHPGSGAALKNWTAERWVEVVGTLRRDRGARVYVTGGPGERELVESIADRLIPRPPNVVGETSLGQLAALFAQSDLVLGCDSGPLHLAAAVGTPTVRLYGPTDTREFGPWTAAKAGVHHRTLTGSIPCRPCRALVNPPCGATSAPACMLEIEASTVNATALDLLGGGGGSSASLSIPKRNSTGRS
jgi:ADP-heptose:LPS heptosyltransferase